MENLLQNCFRYGDTTKPVRMMASPTMDAIHIALINAYKVPLPNEVLEHVFEPFIAGTSPARAKVSAWVWPRSVDHGYPRLAYRGQTNTSEGPRFSRWSYQKTERIESMVRVLVQDFRRYRWWGYSGNPVVSAQSLLLARPD